MTISFYCRESAKASRASAASEAKEEEGEGLEEEERTALNKAKAVLQKAHLGAAGVGAFNEQALTDIAEVVTLLANKNSATNEEKAKISSLIDSIKVRVRAHAFVCVREKVLGEGHYWMGVIQTSEDRMGLFAYVHALVRVSGVGWMGVWMRA